MGSTKVVFHVTAILLLLVGDPLATAAQKKPAKKAPAAKQAVKDVHPEVDPTELCRDCHEAVTPEVFSNWMAGAHGMNNVLCVVCHGGFDNFVRRPGTTRCAGCHAVQTESLATEFMKGKDCFSCHPAHRLIPHAAVPAPDPGVTNQATEGGTQ